MDVLRRPTDGIADRRFGRGTWYDFVAYLVQTRSQSGYRAVFRPARLGLRLCMLLTLPAAVGLAVLSFPLVTTLFMYREFTLHDAQMTQHALIAYSFGLIGLIMIKVLAPGFYAAKTSKPPLRSLFSR